jgi:hypothetical protein
MDPNWAFWKLVNWMRVAGCAPPRFGLWKRNSAFKASQLIKPRYLNAVSSLLIAHSSLIYVGSDCASLHRARFKANIPAVSCCFIVLPLACGDRCLETPQNLLLSPGVRFYRVYKATSKLVVRPMGHATFRLLAHLHKIITLRLFLLKTWLFCSMGDFQRKFRQSETINPDECVAEKCTLHPKTFAWKRILPN